jgi:NADP-dependent 3-hydroxy acid dehydrogenase YdfG
MGRIDNRHLNYFAESINMNVGGFYQDVKVSSPPMTDRSVGAVVVVGGWESQPQGEGR